MLAMSSSVHCVSSPWHRATRKRVSRSRVGCRSSSGFRGGASSSATSHAHEEKEAGYELEHIKGRRALVTAPGGAQTAESVFGMRFQRRKDILMGQGDCPNFSQRIAD